MRVLDVKEQKAAIINYCQIQKTTSEHNYHNPLKDYAPEYCFLHFFDTLYLFLTGHPPSFLFNITVFILTLTLTKYDHIVLRILSLELLLLFFGQRKHEFSEALVLLQVVNTLYRIFVFRQL